MSDWAAKRFWDNVAVDAGTDGFCILLDERPVRTPAKVALNVPSRKIADAIAGEWEAQTGKIDPESMPWTRAANAAIDKVGPRTAEVADHLIGYAATDLLCYRAQTPTSLIQRQSECWDPLLDWAESKFDARLKVTSGVMPIAQPDQAMSKLRNAIDRFNAFQLTGFYDLVTVSGSFVIALHATTDPSAAPSLWLASRLDEIWQSEQWGSDDEAEAYASKKEAAFLHAARFFHAA